MKKLFVYTLLALFSAVNVWAQDEEELKQVVEHKVLEGYFIKPEVKVSKGLNYWLITDQEQFDSMFGVAQTMGVKIEHPDFNTQYVFAIAVPETRMKTYLAFKRVEIVNEKDIKILCVHMEDYKESSMSKPVLIGTIAKTPFAKNILFCDETGKEQDKISLNKIDKEKQKVADKLVKAEKEAAEKEAKQAKAEAEKEAKEEKEAAKAQARAEKQKAEDEAMKAKEEELQAAKAEKQRMKDEAAKERRDREEREEAAQQAREEREARLEAERLKKERAELRAREAEDAKERAAMEKEKEEIRKEREERKKERKERRERAAEEEE